MTTSNITIPPTFTDAINNYIELLKGLPAGALTGWMMPRQMGKSTFQYMNRGHRFRELIPVKKGRKGKPHWRYFRALRTDAAWSKQWDTILKSYEDYCVEHNIDYKSWRYVDDHKLADWLRPQLINCTIRFDPLYRNQIAVDFDDEAARTTFYLQWA